MNNLQVGKILACVTCRVVSNGLVMQSAKLRISSNVNKMINPEIQSGRWRRAKNIAPVRKTVSAYKDLVEKVSQKRTL